MVRVFDGSMSETRQERERKIKRLRSKSRPRKISSSGSFRVDTRQSSLLLTTEEAQILQDKTEVASPEAVSPSSLSSSN